MKKVLLAAAVAALAFTACKRETNEPGAGNTNDTTTETNMNDTRNEELGTGGAGDTSAEDRGIDATDVDRKINEELDETIQDPPETEPINPNQDDARH